MLEAVNPSGINGACTLPSYFEGAVEQTGVCFYGWSKLIQPSACYPQTAKKKKKSPKWKTSCVTRDASLHEGSDDCSSLNVLWQKKKKEALHGSVINISVNMWRDKTLLS